MNLEDKYLKYLSILSQNGGARLDRESYSTHVDRWINQAPKIQYERLANEVRRRPDVLHNHPEGFAIWKDPMDGILRHEIKDEIVKHCVPSPHIDFLYTTIIFFIPPEVVPSVQKISGSVMLDLLKNEVTARCGSTAANYATLKTVVDLVNDFIESQDKSLSYNKERVESKLPSTYSNNIYNARANEYSNRNFVARSALENQKRFATNINQEFHPYPFPNGCNTN